MGILGVMTVQLGANVAGLNAGINSAKNTLSNFAGQAPGLLGLSRVGIFMRPPGKPKERPERSTASVSYVQA